MNSRTVTIVGAGPIGCTLATLLARRGWSVEVYEKRPDIREVQIGGGRSINFVLTDRGLDALERVGLREQVLALTVPVLGRMMHNLDHTLAYQPYGKDDSECNYAISRTRLNQRLLDAAEAAGVRIHFGHGLVAAEFGADDDSPTRLRFEVDGAPGVEVTAQVVFGCDGAPSVVRRALVEHGAVDEQVEMMAHGYKEVLFPAALAIANGDAPDREPGAPPFAMAGHALHIWPRGQHFLMGLANLDGSFTGTLYLPLDGEVSFAALQTAEDVQAYFERYYPDAVPLLGDFAAELLERPIGSLGTVRAQPWHLGRRVALVGDAAHGIVPFFGQGLNAGLEDCVLLDDLLDAHGDDPGAVFATFSQRRKPDADAIADMALENFVEMSAKVGDAAFLMQKRVEAILERELGDRYRSRYAMVMYSDIPYSVAFEIGHHQQAILAELARGLSSPEDVDLARARELIDARLVPLYERFGVEMGF